MCPHEVSNLSIFPLTWNMTTREGLRDKVLHVEILTLDQQCFQGKSLSKRWKCGIKETSAKTEVRTGLQEELSHPAMYPQLLQTGRDVPAHQQKGGSTILSRRRQKTSLHPSQSETVAVQPIRRLYTLDSQLPPMDSLVITAPPKYPSFPYKSKFPFLVF